MPVMNNEGRSPGVVNYQDSGVTKSRRGLAYEKMIISHKARKEAAMIYQKVSADMKFVDREKEVEKFWKDNDIFQKSIDNRKEGPTYLQLLMVSHILDMYLQELLRI